MLKITKTKTVPKLGETRTIKYFAWFPVEFYNPKKKVFEKRWLETVHVKQEFVSMWVSLEDGTIYKWVSIGFADENEIKYLVEINQILKDCFHESWMDENDWDLFLIEINEKQPNLTKKLSDDIITGINNGHSLETQIEIIKKNH